MTNLDKKIEKLQFSFSKIMKKLGPELSEDVELGLTGAQFFILHLLSTREKFMASEIACEMGVAPSAITAIIDRLAKNGLVHRERDDNDRRVVFVSVSEKGHDVYHKAKLKRNETISKYMSQLDPEELDALVRIYDKLANIVTRRDIGQESNGGIFRASTNNTR